jgi:quercetin dioxygenase-like cupin family protein
MTIARSRLISRIKSIERSSNMGRPLGAALVKDPGLNVMLMLLKKGAHLHEHRTKGPLTLQVIAGLVHLVAANKPNELTAGSILALDRDVPTALKRLRRACCY